jgi:hypothetical protein
MTNPSLSGSACRGLGLGAIVLAAAVASQSAAAVGPFGTNLVVNGDAESNLGAANLTSSVVPTGWTTSNGFTALRYNAGGPTAASPGPTNRGNSLFAGGPTGQITSATQSIDVSQGAGVIDAGIATYALSAFLGGSTGQDDTMILSLTFNAASGESVGTATVNGPTAAQRGGQTALLLRSRSGTVPAGTRTINIAVVANRTSGVGTYNDGYADNISLRLTNPCVADFTLDGGVGIEDLLDYLAAFENGNTDADVDDGSSTGIPDGGVGIEDLLYFLVRFEAGC